MSTAARTAGATMLRVLAAFGWTAVNQVVFPFVVLAGMLLVWLALFAVFLSLGGDPDVTEYELGHDTGHHATEA